MPSCRKNTSVLPRRPASAGAAILLLLAAGCATTPEPPVLRCRIVVGSRQAAGAEGLRTAIFDPASGALEAGPGLAGIASPTWVAASADGRRIYVTSEAGGADGGRVAAVSLDPATGALALLDLVPAGGGGPCHLSLAPDGRHVLVAHYGSGGVSSLPVLDDGRLVPPVSALQHEGRGADPARQSGPHAHGIWIDPSGRFALAPDLGIDRVLVHGFDAATGAIRAREPPGAALAPGSGPRHLAFSPDGRFVVVSSELANAVTVFAWDAENGRLEERQTLSTLPEGASGKSYVSTLRFAPGGRRLYVANRGHDSFAIFDYDARTGRLSPPRHASTGGKFPWDFAFDPSGRHLFVANNGSDEVVALLVDPATGLPSPTGARLAIPKPTCVLIRCETSVRCQARN